MDSAALKSGMEVAPRNGIDGRIFEVSLDWEDDVDRPRSRVMLSFGVGYFSSWAGSGKEAGCSGLGDSFLRRMLGWRGREKFRLSAAAAPDCSGVCRPSEE